MNKSIEILKKKGFTPISTTDDYTLLKSSTGFVYSFNDGTIEGFLKGTKNNLLPEGKSNLKLKLLILMSLGITYFTTDITVIVGSSMEPTYKSGKVIINVKSRAKIEELLNARNAVVKFWDPQGFGTCVKRVVAVPGDEIKMEGLNIYVNNRLVDDRNYDGRLRMGRLALATHTKPKPEIFKLSNDEFFVIGDNSEMSDDSRSYGPIKKDAIISIIQK